MGFYDLRHGNATLMLKASVAPKVAAERLGHATIIAPLHDTYAHMLSELDQDAAEKIGEGLRQATRRARRPGDAGPMGVAGTANGASRP